MNHVYQDITKSDIEFEVDDIKFYFSSLFNKERFKKRFEDYVNEEGNKIMIKYKLPINMKKYLLLSLYHKIEIRGFLVEISGKLLKIEDININTNILFYKEL